MTVRKKIPPANLKLPPAALSAAPSTEALLEDDMPAEITAGFEQVTDAVTQTNVATVASSPAMAQGSLYQMAAQATGVMFENAVTLQNNSFTTLLATTSHNVKRTYGRNSIVDILAIARMLARNRGV